MWSLPFLLYLIGATLARLADEGARVALVLLAIEAGGGAGAGGLLVAAFLVPHVVAAPLLGRAIDRARAPLAVAALGIGVVALALGAAGLLVGRAPLPLAAGLLALGGCGGPAMAGGLSSQLGRLVVPEQVPRAFGLDGLTYNTAGIVGPALAAALSGLASAQTATLALAGMGLAGASVLLAVRTRASGAGGSESPGAEPATAETPLLAGLRAITHDRLLGATTLATAAAQVGLGALAVVLAAAAEAEGDPTRAGWLLSAMAGGAVLGSLLWTTRPASAARAPLVIALGLAATGSALGGLAWLPPSSLLSVALFVLAGLAGALAFGATLVVRDDRAPAPLRGQVFSLAAGAKITAGALGAALGGVLLRLPLPMLWVAAAPLAAGLLLVPVANKGAAGQERR